MSHAAVAEEKLIVVCWKFVLYRKEDLYKYGHYTKPHEISLKWSQLLTLPEPWSMSACHLYFSWHALSSAQGSWTITNTEKWDESNKNHIDASELGLPDFALCDEKNVVSWYLRNFCLLEIFFDNMGWHLTDYQLHHQAASRDAASQFANILSSIYWPDIRDANNPIMLDHSSKYLWPGVHQHG